MVSCDLVVRGGTVVTPAEVLHCDVGIQGDRIVALGNKLDGAEVLVAVLQRDRLDFNVTSEVLSGVERSFASFSNVITLISSKLWRHITLVRDAWNSIAVCLLITKLTPTWRASSATSIIKNWRNGPPARLNPTSQRDLSNPVPFDNVLQN